MCVYGHMSKKSRVGWSAFFILILSAKPEIVVPSSGIRYFIFEISGKPSFVEAVLWRVTQFFYLLCSQFLWKASGWINKTLLLIKQHITYMYMNIQVSRYANIDKFVNNEYPIYIFLLARRAYRLQLIISASPNVEIASPGRRASGFVNPWLPSVLLVVLVFMLCRFCSSSSCVLCTQCCRCLRIVHSWFLHHCSLTLCLFLNIPKSCLHTSLYITITYTIWIDPSLFFRPFLKGEKR